MASVQAVMSEESFEKVQNAPTTVQEEWSETQDSLAASSGLALVLMDGQKESVLLASNNNSICQAFLTSSTFRHHCQIYCGTVHKRVNKGGEVEHYRCHAGLYCFATRIESKEEDKLTIIGGRAFLSSDDYKKLTERFIKGDLKKLFSNEILKNIIFSSNEKIDDLLIQIKQHSSTAFTAKPKDAKSETISHEINANAVEKESKSESVQNVKDYKQEESVELSKVIEPEADSSMTEFVQKEETEEQTQLEFEVEEQDESKANPIVVSKVKKRTHLTEIAKETLETVKENLKTKSGKTKKTPEFLPLENYYFTENAKRNYVLLLKPLVDKHSFSSVSLLVRQGNRFVPAYITGRFRHNPVQIQIDPWDDRLTQAAKSETSITLKPIQERKDKSAKSASGSVIELFPMTYKDDVLGVLLIGQPLRHAAQRREVSAFCREAAMQLEIVRLNAELERRAWIFGALQRLAERVNSLAPEETYRSVLSHSSELLGSERASLLLFDEDTNELEVKAAFGPRAQQATTTRLQIGEGVAGQVFQLGHPIIANDVTDMGYAPAPSERRYKSNSFISFPLIIGGRKLGVLNLTDKIGGGTYDDRDLKLIENIAPHLALAIGRAEWQEKATEFELKSITDPLTGLLNRRYLEERMEEEVKRCQRHNYQMSFLMIDIDDFKYYNDNNGHQEGDKALEITARLLKSVLRADDVAARYGGEEFSILLPQTSLEEGETIADRIRIKIEDENFPNGKDQPLGKVTVSIGVAGYTTTLITPEAIIGAADRALYLAKRQSKNCVKVLDQLHSVPFLNAPENPN